MDRIRATIDRQLERGLLSLLLISSAVYTRCAGGQTPADTFARDVTGHRVVPENSAVALALTVTEQLAAILKASHPEPRFFCVTARPAQYGVLVTALTPTDATAPKPRCADPQFAGGLILAPHATLTQPDLWVNSQQILAGRPDFVTLLIVDSLTEEGPQVRWIIATPVPVDTTSPAWKRQT